MKYDFDKVTDRSHTYASKTDALPAGCPDDALPAWVADMDLVCAEPILNAIRSRVDHGIFGYTRYDNKDCKTAVKGWYKRRFDWDIEAGHLFYSPGVVPALGMLLQAITEPGDGIVIQKPVYYPFMMMIGNNGRRIVNNPLIRRENEEAEGVFDYTMDFEDLEKKMADPSNAGMILSSPHNPVGRVWTREELTKVIEICKKYGKWIIADEIHCDLTRCGVKHTPLLKLAGEIAPEYCERIVACVAPSKTFNLAGLTFSNIVIPGAEFQKKWTAFVDGQFSLGHGCNPLSLAGVMAAYNEGDEWLDQLKEYLDGNIEYIGQFVKERMPKAKTAACQGTYLLWVDMNGYLNCTEGDEEARQKEVERLEYAMQKIGRVALDEGYIFGTEGGGYERINVAMPRSLVEDCMERMAKAAEWLESGQQPEEMNA